MNEIINTFSLTDDTLITDDARDTFQTPLMYI